MSDQWSTPTLLLANPAIYVPSLPSDNESLETLYGEYKSPFSAPSSPSEAAGYSSAAYTALIFAAIIKKPNVATKSAADRASEIHRAVPSATQSRTTIAVTETSQGTRIISSSEKRLRPAQRRLLGKGEVEGIGAGHAEVTGVSAARGMGLNPTGTAASRPICQGCQGFLKEQGVNPLSTLKK